MPAKKIDPDEKKQYEKRKNVKTKLLFAGLLAALVLVTNVYISRTRDNVSEVVNQMSADRSRPRVLGQTTEDERARFERVQKQTQLLAEQITTQSEQLITDSKTKVEDTVTELVYKTTIKPLIDRIRGLPDEHQEYIKEAICSDPSL